MADEKKSGRFKKLTEIGKTVLAKSFREKRAFYVETGCWATGKSHGGK